MPWAVITIFFIGSSYLFATAESTKDYIEAIGTFMVSFFLLLLFTRQNEPWAKKILDLF
jgi:hypothetical protein